MMTADHPPLPRGLADAPPNARLVWMVLDKEGPLTRPELISQCYVSERTLDRILDDSGVLRERGFVTQTVATTDGCQHAYEAHRQPSK